MSWLVCFGIPPVEKTAWFLGFSFFKRSRHLRGGSLMRKLRREKNMTQFFVASSRFRVSPCLPLVTARQGFGGRARAVARPPLHGHQNKGMEKQKRLFL